MMFLLADLLIHLLGVLLVHGVLYGGVLGLALHLGDSGALLLKLYVTISPRDVVLSLS